MADDPLTTLRRITTRLERARTQLAAMEQERADEIRRLFAITPAIPRADIADAAKLHPQRLYQIRDGRRK